MEKQRVGIQKRLFGLRNESWDGEKKVGMDRWELR